MHHFLWHFEWLFSFSFVEIYRLFSCSSLSFFGENKVMFLAILTNIFITIIWKKRVVPIMCFMKIDESNNFLNTEREIEEIKYNLQSEKKINYIVVWFIFAHSWCASSFPIKKKKLKFLYFIYQISHQSFKLLSTNYAETLKC